MNIYRRDVQATLKEEFSIATIECYTVHWAQLWSQRGRSEGFEDISGKREVSFKMGSTFEIPLHMALSIAAIPSSDCISAPCTCLGWVFMFSYMCSSVISSYLSELYMPHLCCQS